MQKKLKTEAVLHWSRHLHIQAWYSLPTPPGQWMQKSKSNSFLVGEQAWPWTPIFYLKNFNMDSEKFQINLIKIHLGVVASCGLFDRPVVGIWFIWTYAKRLLKLHHLLKGTHTKGLMLALLKSGTSSYQFCTTDGWYEEIQRQELKF